MTDGTTPLDPDEADGLIPGWVATRGDLDVVEQANVAAAMQWASRRRWSIETLLSDATVRDVHRRMLGDVWNWAGSYRTSEKNIGVPWADVRRAIHDLMADAMAWVDSERPSESLLADFHHQIVSIHPFPNGNGRHGRLMTDLLATVIGVPPSTWGRAPSIDIMVARRHYLDALSAADRGSLEPLLRVMFPARIGQ